MGSSDSDGSKKNLIMGSVAGCAILACIVWFIYLATSGGPVVINPATDPAMTDWMKGLAAKQAELYQQMEKVVIAPTEDGKSIRATGSVKSAADLAKLKAVLEAIEPKHPIIWEVKIGM